MAGQRRTAKKSTKKPAPGKTRPKRKARTPVLSREERFLAALAETGNVVRACLRERVSRSWLYELRSRDEAFAKRWDEAAQQGADVLEEEAYRRAMEGTSKPVFYKGKLVRTRVVEYSDTLLIFLLKGARPEKYRDNWKGELTGGGGTPLVPGFEDALKRVYGEKSSDNGSNSSNSNSGPQSAG
jgi:hypothetical protein